MKKIFVVILTVLFLCGCSVQSYEKPTQLQATAVSEPPYVASVWLTYYELQKLYTPTAGAFQKKMKALLEEIKAMGFNTLTVQVRAYADAIYPSDYFPSSAYFVEKQGDALPYDALQIICNTAQKEDIRVEAWVNPYRVSKDKDISRLDEGNMAKKWYNNKKTKRNVYICDSGIYFNPASSDVTKLLVSGVAEIVKNYPISAIHFDDYFYPTTKKEIDKTEYKKYKKKGGNLPLSDWRRQNVSAMIKSVYSAVKNTNSGVLFGISPAANIRRNYEELFADVETWMTKDGYCDYICPQVYFGFKNVYQPFMFTVKKWVGLSKKTLCIGLPLYKCGRADKYAAQNDKEIINEFKNNDNIIARQITYLSKIEEVKGFYVFSYSALHDEKCKKEVENMISVMQNSSLLLHQTSE